MGDSNVLKRVRTDDVAAIRLLQRVAVIANEADSFAGAIQAVLDEVCSYTGWPVGHAYLPGVSGGLDTTPLWHLDDPGAFENFRTITESMSMPVGAGLPGRIIEQRRSAWIVDVLVDDNFPRAKRGVDIGVHGAFGFPVMTGRDIAAVLEFFSTVPQPVDAELLGLMTYVGTQLGRVAERELGARQLRAQVEHNEHLIQSAYDAFVSIDDSGCITGWNHAAEQMFGWTHAEVAGRPLAATIIPPSYRDAHLSGVSRYLTTGEAHVLNKRIELSAVDRDGREFPIELAIWPVGYHGVTNFCAFIHDITERKQIESEQAELVQQLRDLDEAKTKFVSSVSHELRTPLTSIIGYHELLLLKARDELTPQSQEFLDIIGRNTQRLLALIEDLLTQSSVESGTFNLLVEPTQITRVVESAVESVLPSAAHNDIALTVNLDPNLGTIPADATQIERLVLNLLTNAIKFTPAGSVTVVVRPVGQGAEIVVSDTGIGIPANDRSKLFSAFFRSSNADRAVAGTGLGLVIVKAIVDAHHGTIDVRSEQGVGTEITVRLPGSDQAAGTAA